MSTFSDTWSATTVSDNEQTEPPEPGTYEIALDDARAFTAKSGKDWFVVELRIVTGENMGHQWSVLADLTKDGGVKAAKSMSAKLGVPIDEIGSLDDLDRLAKQHVGSYYEVDVVQRGDFRNTYFRGPITGEQMSTSDVPADVPTAAAPGAAVADDEIPF